MNNRETAKFSKEIKINDKDNLENITQYLLELEQNSKLFDEKIQKLNKLNDINNDNNEGNILELETKEIDTDNSLANVLVDLFGQETSVEVELGQIDKE